MKWEHFTDSKPISYREYAIILVESSKYFCEQVFFCGTQGELASVCVHSVLKPLKSASVSHLLLPPTGSPPRMRSCTVFQETAVFPFSSIIRFMEPWHCQWVKCMRRISKQMTLSTTNHTLILQSTNHCFHLWAPSSSSSLPWSCMLMWNPIRILF